MSHHLETLRIATAQHRQALQLGDREGISVAARWWLETFEEMVSQKPAGESWWNTQATPDSLSLNFE